MYTNEDIWLDARDAWGVDRLAWEEDEDDDAGDGDLGTDDERARLTERKDHRY